MTLQSKNIPVGYKDSPLGIIPQEWEVKRLGEIGIFYGGGTPSKSIDEYWHGDIPWISSADLIENDIYWCNINRFITLEAVRNSSTQIIPQNSILIVTRVGVGKVAVAPCDLCVSQDYICLQNSGMNTIFLAYEIMQRMKNIVSQIQGTSIKGISINEVKKIQLPLPPLAEQEKIAEILSTWDKAIEKQTQLIQKLELLKKGLMQQLLTGKKRLPGFYKKWAEIELGEILSYEQPTLYLVHDVNYQNNYKIPVLTAGKTFILGYTNEENGICKNIPVILFDDFTTDSRYINFEFKIKSSATKLLRAKGQNNLYFIYCALQCFKYTIGGHERHWISKFQYLTISLPSIEEQIAIVEVMDVADRKIELAQQKLEQLRQQKHGLMQQLLTGKKRVNYGN